MDIVCTMQDVLAERVLSCRSPFDGLKSEGGYTVSSPPPPLSTYLNQFFSDPQAQFLGRGRVNDSIRYTINDIDLVIKRNVYRGWLPVIRRTCWRSRARIAFNNAKWLRSLGIPTFKPLLFIEEWKGLIKRKCFFVATYVQGVSLDVYLNSPSLSLEEAQKTLQSLARSLKVMYQHKVTHGDLRARNIIIAAGTPFFIDLDNLRKHKLSARFAYFKQRDFNKLYRCFQDNPVIQALITEYLSPHILY